MDTKKSDKSVARTEPSKRDCIPTAFVYSLGTNYSQPEKGSDSLGLAEHLCLQIPANNSQ